MNLAEKRNALKELHAKARECRQCPLYKTRIKAAPGQGPANAKIMFIAEAPGAEEDKAGLPFIGRAGNFFDGMLSLAGLERKGVFITSTVKCRPPKNRNPKAGEIKTCKKLYLDRQLEIIRPGLVVLLGNIAIKALLGKGTASKLHGKVLKKEGLKFFATFHPAAGMRFPKIERQMTADFLRLKKLKK